jgi:predicted RNase H-like nuclease (RuvC/YqgF family)
MSNSQEELLIYYEHEIQTLRSRIRQQNNEITNLSRHLQIRYELYSSLENDYNSMKEEYEKMKLEYIRK